MTRRERLESKLERRLDWAESRKQKAVKHFAVAQRICNGIPFGQPILVGHHSEKHHRADMNRIDSNMHNGCESEKMASYHEQKADGLDRQLKTSIFSDDENAIEALQEKITNLEAEKNRMKALNSLIRKEIKTGLTDGWLTRINATEPEKIQLLHNVKYGNFNGTASPLYPAYSLTNLSGRIRQAKQRIEEIQRQNVRKEQAEESGGISIVGNGEYCTITFSEKPERDVLTALKSAGFHWSGGSWCGRKENIPEQLTAA